MQRKPHPHFPTSGSSWQTNALASVPGSDRPGVQASCIGEQLRWPGPESYSGAPPPAERTIRYIQSCPSWYVQGFTVFCCVHFKDGDTEVHQEKPLLEGAVTLTSKLVCQSHAALASPGQESRALLSELNTVGHRCGMVGGHFPIGADIHSHVRESRNRWTCAGDSHLAWPRAHCQPGVRQTQRLGCPSLLQSKAVMH